MKCVDCENEAYDEMYIRRFTRSVLIDADDVGVSRLQKGSGEEYRTVRDGLCLHIPSREDEFTPMCGSGDEETDWLKEAVESHPPGGYHDWCWECRTAFAEYQKELDRKYPGIESK